MYKFTAQGKEYELREDNLLEFINDEDKPVAGIKPQDILGLLGQQGEVPFEIEYYNQACQTCFAGKEEKAKYFSFLVYSFYIYTKEGQYVMSNISKEYEGLSYNKLLKKGLVDDSYSVNIIVCDSCGDYSIEIIHCDM